MGEGNFIIAIPDLLFNVVDIHHFGISVYQNQWKPIDLEFMGIQSPDIMADSVDAKQMLLTLDNKTA